MSMTFLQLQDELITQPGARFKPSQRASIKLWINARYGLLWGMEDWTFRKASSTVVVTASNATAAAPSDFGIGYGLWTNLGDVVRYVTPKDYFNLHTGPVFSGIPTAYTVINKQIFLDPTPSATATYTTFYERGFTELDDDGDVPLLPGEYHYALITGALSKGSVMMQDFTYQFAEQEWQNELQGMRRSYLADVRGELVQWGSY